MILVTGGFGLIGANVAKRLAHEGYEVVVLDRIVDKSSDFFAECENIHFENVDMLDPFALTSVFNEYDIKTVIHAAATTDGEYCKKNPVGAVKTNTIGTLHLLELSRKFDIERFIYISSGSIFGLQKTLDPIDESVQPTPMNPYATTKLLSEELVRCYVVNFGLQATSVRISHVFGATPIFRKPRWNQGPINYYFWKVLTENQLNEETGADFQANFTHVDDVAEGIYRIVATEDVPSYINLGSEKMYSTREIIDFIRQKLPDRKIEVGPGVEPFVKQAPLRGPLISNYKKEIGYTPTVDFHEALNKHFQWMKRELAKRGELHADID